MSVNPNAPMGDPPKCTTCDGDKKDKNVQVAGMKSEEFPMAGGHSVNVLTTNTGSMIVTTYDAEGLETGTYHLDKNGFQQ